jgi:hypothetical protein
MKTSRIDELIMTADSQIYEGYVDVLKGCLYGKPEHDYSAFEYSCAVASSRKFPYELREFARIISNPSNENLKSTVSRMIHNEDFCSQVKKYFETEPCEYEDLKSVLYPLANVIWGYQKKKKLNSQNY